MSANEIPIITVEAETERSTPRPQRPPPPPPPTHSEPPSPIDIITLSSEYITPTVTDMFDGSIKDGDYIYPSLLKFQFNELFDNFDYELIRHKILTREMKACPFTSVLWRIFLHCLPRDSSHWDQTIDLSREHYNDLAAKYLLDQKKLGENHRDPYDVNHPLSQDEDSPWHQYFIHRHLKDNIEQDVRRTCQDIEFFRQPHVLKLLLEVLFIHSRYHEETLPYRQGMHEILAVIVYLIHTESLLINEYPEANELMKKLYEPKYLAHDAYAIYEKIMEHLQQYYDFKPNIVSSHKYTHIHDKSQLLFRGSSIPVLQLNDTVMRVDAIFERLKDHCEQLYEKLKELSIEPAVYGIRWLRLLFGREIPFESIPNLWTVIFCHDECFGFVDYFFLALLIKIGQLFDRNDVTEYSCCLQYLMQPNEISDVESVIQKALQLERTARQSFTSSYDGQFNRPLIKELSKPSTPNSNSTHNPLLDSMRSNSTASFISSAQYSKLTTADASKDSEMASSPGKEMRRQYEDNVQIQSNCAKFIHQFIERIRNRIRSLQSSNEEEIMLQLNGLEQIANVLENKLPFDHSTLQALLNYKSKEKLNENQTNDTI